MGAATGNPPLPFHRILPLLSISLSLVSAFFKSLAAVDDDGAEKIKLTERLKDFLISRQRVFADSDQSSYPQLDQRLLVHLHRGPRSVAVRKCFVHPQRRDQVARRQSMSWCQITPSRPIEPALQNPPCPSTQHIARGVTVTRDQYQSTLSHLSVPNNKLTQDSVFSKVGRRGRVAILTLEHGSDTTKVARLPAKGCRKRVPRAG